MPKRSSDEGLDVPADPFAPPPVEQAPPLELDPAWLAERAAKQEEARRPPPKPSIAGVVAAILLIAAAVAAIIYIVKVR